MEGLGADTVVFQPSSPFGYFVYFCENIVLSYSRASKSIDDWY